MPGSLDNITDALKSLERDGVFFILVIGREREAVTRCFCNMKGCIDSGTETHVHEVISRTFNRERELSGNGVDPCQEPS